MKATPELIKSQLTAAFSPTYLHVTDESHLHHGHAGAQAGKGHYAVEIHSQAFANLSTIQRHRLIYQALGKLMDSKIHALSIKATATGQ